MSDHHRLAWEDLHISESAAIECRARGRAQLPGRRRVFTGTVFPPGRQPENGLPLTTVDDGEQARDLSDMVAGLDGKRVRITVEVLDEPPTPPLGTGDER